jgi:hypothetical protein
VAGVRDAGAVGEAAVSAPRHTRRQRTPVRLSGERNRLESVTVWMVPSTGRDHCTRMRPSFASTRTP